jgi:Trk K+ transport system NAD-binding subunit
LIGYSTTIGAFVGGVVLGNTIYKTEVYGNLKPLIIFFNMLFFVGLGFQMQFSFSPYILLTIGIFALISFFIKPIVIFITLRNRGYDIRTCFLSGLYLAQISEFGIIIFVGSVSAGLIGSSLNSLAIILIIVTMLISSYFIKYDKKIFNFFVEDLEKLDKFFTLNKNEEEKKDIEIDAQIVFFGYYEFGKELMENLQQSSKKIIVIENDPEHIEMLKRDKIKYVFGTPYSPEFFEHVKFKNPELVISNKLDVTQNKMIIKELKKLYPNVIVIVTARRISDSLDLYKYNADYVIYPSYINEQHISVLLQEYTVDINKMIAKKVTDLSKFQKKKEEEIETTHSLFQDVDVFLKDMQSRMKNKQIIMGHGKINSNTFNDQEVKEKMSANELLGSIIEHDKENKKEENSKKTPDK